MVSRLESGASAAPWLDAVKSDLAVCQKFVQAAERRARAMGRSLSPAYEDFATTVAAAPRAAAVPGPSGLGTLGLLQAAREAAKAAAAAAAPPPRPPPQEPGAEAGGGAAAVRGPEPEPAEAEPPSKASSPSAVAPPAPAPEEPGGRSPAAAAPPAPAEASSSSAQPEEHSSGPSPQKEDPGNVADEAKAANEAKGRGAELPAAAGGQGAGDEASTGGGGGAPSSGSSPVRARGMARMQSMTNQVPLVDVDFDVVEVPRKEHVGFRVARELRRLLSQCPYLVEDVDSGEKHPLYHWVVRCNDCLREAEYDEAEACYDRLVSILHSDQARIRSAFRRFDENGDGYLENAEFESMCYYIGFDMSLKDMDHNSDGQISLSEFERFVAKFGGVQKLFEKRRQKLEEMRKESRNRVGFTVGSRVRTHFIMKGRGPKSGRKSRHLKEATVISIGEESWRGAEVDDFGGTLAVRVEFLDSTARQTVPSTWIVSSPEESAIAAAMKEVGIGGDEQGFWVAVYSTSEMEAVAQLTSSQRNALAQVRAEATKSHRDALPDIRARFEGLGFTSRDLAAVLAWAQDLAPVLVHVSIDKVGEFLETDEYYRNQFETKTSAGWIDPGGQNQTRVGWERQLFGPAYDDAKPFERCKYGVLNVHNDYKGVQPAYQYGDSYLVLKDVRLRCTFTAEDSGGLAGSRLAVLDRYAHVLQEYNDQELKDLVAVATSPEPRASSDRPQLLRGSTEDPAKEWITVGYPALAQRRGRFYFEVELERETVSAQVGLLSTRFQLRPHASSNSGVGDDEHGWAVDGQHSAKLHDGPFEAWGFEWPTHLTTLASPPKRGHMFLLGLESIAKKQVNALSRKIVVGVAVSLKLGERRIWCSSDGVWDESPTFDTETVPTVDLYPAISFKGGAAFNFGPDFKYPPKEPDFTVWPGAPSGRVRIDCPCFCDSQNQDDYKEVQIHGEVSLKTHVQRLVANPKYRDIPKTERNWNIRTTGAGQCSGTYKWSGRREGKSLYKNDSGAIIFWDEASKCWRMNPTPDFKAKHFFCKVTVQDTSSEPPRAGWEVPPEAHGVLPSDGFRRALAQEAVEREGVKRLTEALGGRDADGREVIFRQKPTTSFDAEWERARGAVATSADAMWTKAVEEVQRGVLHSLGLPRGTPVFETEHPYQAGEVNQRIVIPGAERLVVHFSDQCCTKDERTCIGLYSGGLHLDSAGVGARVRIQVKLPMDPGGSHYAMMAMLGMGSMSSLPIPVKRVGGTVVEKEDEVWTVRLENSELYDVRPLWPLLHARSAKDPKDPAGAWVGDELEHPLILSWSGDKVQGVIQEEEDEILLVGTVHDGKVSFRVESWASSTESEEASVSQDNLPGDDNAQEKGDGKAPEVRLCPEGHSLKPFEVAREGFVCDLCGTNQKPGAVLQSCRKCNFDVCPDCISSVPTRQPAPEKCEATLSADGLVMNGTLGDEPFTWRRLSEGDFFQRCPKQAVAAVVQYSSDEEAGSEITGFDLDKSHPAMPFTIRGLKGEGAAQRKGVQAGWFLDLASSWSKMRAQLEKVKGDGAWAPPEDYDEAYDDVEALHRALNALLSQTGLQFSFCNGIAAQLLPEACVSYGEDMAVGDEIRELLADADGWARIGGFLPGKRGPANEAGVRLDWQLNIRSTLELNPRLAARLTLESLKAHPKQLLAERGVQVVFELPKSEKQLIQEFSGSRAEGDWEPVRVPGDAVNIVFKTDGDLSGPPEQRWGAFAIVLRDGESPPPLEDINRLASLWPEVKHRAAGVKPDAVRVERAGWDEHRLRALCDKHGWEFEWMSEDGERRRRMNEMATRRSAVKPERAFPALTEPDAKAKRSRDEVLLMGYRTSSSDDGKDLPEATAVERDGDEPLESLAIAKVLEGANGPAEDCNRNLKMYLTSSGLMPQTPQVQKESYRSMADVTDGEGILFVLDARIPHLQFRQLRGDPKKWNDRWFVAYKREPDKPGGKPVLDKDGSPVLKTDAELEAMRHGFASPAWSLRNKGHFSNVHLKLVASGLKRMPVYFTYLWYDGTVVDGKPDFKILMGQGYWENNKFTALKSDGSEFGEEDYNDSRAHVASEENHFYKYVSEDELHGLVSSVNTICGCGGHAAHLVRALQLHFHDRKTGQPMEHTNRYAKIILDAIKSGQVTYIGQSTGALCLSWAIAPLVDSSKSEFDREMEADALALLGQNYLYPPMHHYLGMPFRILFRPHLSYDARRCRYTSAAIKDEKILQMLEQRSTSCPHDVYACMLADYDYGAGLSDAVQISGGKLRYLVGYCGRTDQLAEEAKAQLQKLHPEWSAAKPKARWQPLGGNDGGWVFDWEPWDGDVYAAGPKAERPFHCYAGVDGPLADAPPF